MPLAFKNKFCWLMFVLTHKPKYAPNPSDVAEQTRQEKIENLWRRIREH